MTDYQGVSLTEAYDNRSVMAQIARIKDRLAAVEQNVDPTLRTDLEAAVSELETLETTVSGVQTQVDGNAESIGDLQDDLGAFETATNAALALKADSADVDADLDLKADKTQLMDGSVTKVGTATVGSSTKAVYLDAGTPTECGLMLPITKYQSYDQPVNPIDISKTLQIRSTTRITSTVFSGYEDGKVSTTGSDATASHVWVGRSYNLPGTSSTTDSAMGVSQVILTAFENSTTSRTYRIAVVDLLVYQNSGVDAKLRHGVNVDKVVMAKKDNTIFICIKIQRTAERIAARHFGSPMIGNHVEALDTSTASTGMSFYENVVYDGEDIPNFTNYSEWSWTTLS